MRQVALLFNVFLIHDTRYPSFKIFGGLAMRGLAKRSQPLMDAGAIRECRKS
jgi:hypothetical protein